MAEFKFNKSRINAEKRYLNRKFGKLRIVNLFVNNSVLMADCVCDCGNIKAISAYNIWIGLTRSCGCLRDENKSRIIPKDDFKKIRDEYFSKKKSGMKITYNEIAERYGVTRQRIYQIIRG